MSSFYVYVLRRRILDRDTVLDVEAVDVSEGAADELRDDGEEFSGIDGHAWAKEGFVT